MNRVAEAVAGSVALALSVLSLAVQHPRHRLRPHASCPTAVARDVKIDSIFAVLSGRTAHVFREHDGRSLGV